MVLQSLSATQAVQYRLSRRLKRQRRYKQQPQQQIRRSQRPRLQRRQIQRPQLQAQLQPLPVFLSLRLYHLRAQMEKFLKAMDNITPRNAILITLRVPTVQSMVMRTPVSITVQQ